MICFVVTCFCPAILLKHPSVFVLRVSQGFDTTLIIKRNVYALITSCSLSSKKGAEIEYGANPERLNDE